MIQYMLDTNMCIYIIKRKPAGVIERFKEMTMPQVGISSITLSELLYGVAKSSKPEQNQLALVQFAAPLEILPYDDGAARFYGDLRADLERKGTPMGSLDMLIAAHALSIGCVLITNNEKEFKRIQGLRIENWAA